MRSTSVPSVRPIEPTGASSRAIAKLVSRGALSTAAIQACASPIA
jgi:hypothetical protein